MAGINHVAVYVKDIEAARSFFIKYFGAVSNSGYENPKKKFHSYFLTFSDGFRIEIMHKPDLSEGTSLEAYGYAHIAFSVGSRENVNLLTETLKNDGFTVLSGPRTTGDGYYESLILGPENLRIEVTE